MKKYKLINTTIKEKHLCDKVTTDMFDYYVSDEEIKVGDWYTWDGNKNNAPSLCTDTYNESSILDSRGFTKFYKVIATNNPNIDIPKVVDEIERLTFQEFKDWSFGEHGPWHTYKMFQKGYSKSQETHPNSDEDTIEFGQWVSHNNWVYLPSKKYWVNEEQEELEQKLSSKELLQLWKEQQTKIVYYE